METTALAKRDSAVMELDRAAGFDSPATDIARIGQEAGSVAAVAREEGELKTAIVLARTNPRDEGSCYTKVIRSCQRPTFAEKALYRFPRGGSEISGPSVGMAREIARIWGNIRYGCRVVTQTDDEVHIKGYALDLESNAYVEAEDKFAKLIQRKAKGGGKATWIKPDERDLRELVNRRAAFLVRNCLLSLIPPDVKEDAIDVVNETMRKAASGEIKQDKGQAIRRLLLAFDAIGVNSTMLGEYLGHTLDLLTPEELTDLRQVYSSIKDGNTKREDHFSIPAIAKNESESVADAAPKADSAQLKNGKKSDPEAPQAVPEN